MIEFVKGSVEEVTSVGIVIDHQGLGYHIYCANPFIFTKGHAVKVYTYHYVREDTMRLYGFKSGKERKLFEKLLDVSGIGPKGALAVLAAGNPEQVVQAIEEEDEKYLTKFPGIGKKTARQMILDLKGKMHLFIETDTEEWLASAFNNGETDKVMPDALSEAKEALLALGYSAREVDKVMPELKKKELRTDEYVKEALKLLLNH